MDILELIPRITVMRFKTNQRLKGTLLILDAVVFAVLIALLVRLSGEHADAETWLIINIAPAATLLNGLYLLLLRRKPVVHEVNLGTWADIIYRRNKLLFVVFELAVAVMEYALLVAFFYLMDMLNGSNTVETLLPSMTFVSIIVIYALIHKALYIGMVRFLYYNASMDAEVYNPMNDKMTWRKVIDKVRQK